MFKLTKGNFEKNFSTFEQEFDTFEKAQFQAVEFTTGKKADVLNFAFIEDQSRPSGEVFLYEVGIRRSVPEAEVRDFLKNFKLKAV